MEAIKSESWLQAATFDETISDGFRCIFRPVAPEFYRLFSSNGSNLVFTVFTTPKLFSVTRIL